MEQRQDKGGRRREGEGGSAATSDAPGGSKRQGMKLDEGGGETETHRRLPQIDA